MSDNNVKVTALGEVEAGGTTVVADLDPTFSPFNSVDPVNHTIAVDNTAGYQTGDAITYSAGGGGAMPGLTDGRPTMSSSWMAPTSSLPLRAATR